MAANAIVRTTGGDPTDLVNRLRGHVTALDPELSAQIAPLAEVQREYEIGLRVSALVVAFSLLAVLGLSVAGIYALMSFTVSRRHREIGIRTALGAQPGRLLGGIFGRALTQIGVGVSVGAAVALGLDWLMDGGLMHGLGLPLVAAMVLLMWAIGLLATVGPSRRGLSVAPAEVLNAE
jgi:putative ABC transport system permease protein